MHVLWVNDRGAFGGGAERYVAETAALLARRGARNTLLYGATAPMDPAFTGRFDAAFPAVDPSRQMAAIAPDVVYVHQVADGSLVDAVARSGVPAARFFHDHALFCLREHKYTTIGSRTCTRVLGAGCYPCLGFASRGAERSLRIRTLGALREQQRSHRGLDAIVVGSRYMRRHVVAHGFDPSKVHVCPLFVRPAEGPDDVARDPNELLFVGGLVHGKGLDVLIDALARLPARARLRIVGRGPQRPALEARAVRRGVRERITFAGRLDNGELQHAYRRAACLVMPSRTPETFGLAGPEALVHETPVVASLAGGVDQWLEDGVTGIGVPPGDPAALARGIGRLIASPELARRLGERGRRVCLRELTPDRHLDRLVTVLGAVRRREAA